MILLLNYFLASPNLFYFLTDKYIFLFNTKINDNDAEGKIVKILMDELCNYTHIFFLQKTNIFHSSFQNMSAFYTNRNDSEFSIPKEKKEEDASTDVK